MCMGALGRAFHPVGCRKTADLRSSYFVSQNDIDKEQKTGKMVAAQQSTINPVSLSSSGGLIIMHMMVFHVLQEFGPYSADYYVSEISAAPSTGLFRLKLYDSSDSQKGANSRPYTAAVCECRCRRQCRSCNFEIIDMIYYAPDLGVQNLRSA